MSSSTAPSSSTTIASSPPAPAACSRRGEGPSYPALRGGARTTDAATLRTFEHDVIARDGERFRLRPIRPEDAPRLVALYDRLSRDSRYQRFFAVMQRLPPDWARVLATVDFERRFALVLERAAEPDGEGEVIAVARYEPGAAPDEVEIAFVVADAWQARGLGTQLVRELFRAAAANGYRALRAYVLADNRRMLRLLAREADVRARTLERGVVSLLLTPRPSAPSSS